jgi:hypothetical protein
MLTPETVLTVCRPFSGGDEALIPHYFERLGFRVHNFDDRVYGQHSAPSLMARINRRLMRNQANFEMNKDLSDYITFAKPKILFIFKGHGISPETVQNAKKYGVRTVLFYPDLDPSFGGPDLLKICREVDLFFHTKLDKIEYFKDTIRPDAIGIPYPYNESDLITPKKNLKGLDILFVGNYSKSKQVGLSEISSALDFNIHIAGEGWSNSRPDRAILLGPVYGAALLNLASTARASIGLLQEALIPGGEGDVLTSRSVLLPVMGVPIVHVRNKFSEWLYDGDDRVLFNSYADCAKKMNIILENEDLRIDVALSQQRNIKKNSHSWSNIVHRML